MDLASVWQGLGLREKRNLYILLSAPIIGITAAKLIRSFIYSNSGPNVIPSPRRSLQLLSAQDPDDLPYPPDALPGARDVDTPYGNIRVYEWGPEEGRKVLFLHGISTPCIAFAGMARLLVERGCRVMLFDLFGRGYSDAPDPSLYRQDMGLWTSQILLVLASSKLAWTGTYMTVVNPLVVSNSSMLCLTHFLDFETLANPLHLLCRHRQVLHGRIFNGRWDLSIFHILLP